MIARTASLIACVFLLLAPKAEAQTVFQKSIGGATTDYAMCIRQTNDGGYVMLGHTSSFNAGYWDIFLTKMDQNCVVQWSRVYGDGTQSGNNVGYEVIQTADSGFVIAAHALPPGDGLIMKTDKQGNILWARASAETGVDGFHSVVQTSDGNLVAVGKAQHGLNNDDLFLVKLDTSGNLIWKKSYGTTGYDVGYRLIELPNSELVITGTTSSHGAGWQDVYLLKTDTAGNAIWSKTYGGTEDEIAHDVKHTSDGGFIICGEAYSPVSGMDIYLIKIDSAGTLQWSKTYDGGDGDFSYEVVESPNGGYAVACSTFSYLRGAMLLRVDNGGNFLWAKAYGDPAGLNDFHSVLLPPDGGYLMAGMVYTGPPTNVEMYLVKTDSSGNSGCMQQSVLPAVANPPTQTGSGAVMTTSVSWNTFPVVTVLPSPGVNTFCLITNIDPAEADPAVTMFPNPVTDHRFTVSHAPENGVLTMYNLFGQAVYTQAMTSYPATVNLPSLVPGIYLVEVSNGEQSACSRMVVE